MADQHYRSHPQYGAFKIVLSYAIFAALWILLSDRLVGLIVQDPESIVRASVVKGWVFVLVTALLLYGLLHRLITQLQASHRRELQSERRFEATFEQAATGIALVAPDGRWLRVNRKLCEIVGYDQQEMLARSFQDITYPEDLDADLSYRERLLGEEIETYSREKRYVRKDGRIVWINLTVALVRQQDGTPDYFISVIEDIQARKDVDAALNESRENLRLFIEHAPASLAMFDREMRYLVASRRWLDEHQLGERVIVGRSHYEIFPNIPERWKDVHRRGLAGEVVRADEDRFERPGGAVLWLSWEVRPWYANDGAVGGIVIFCEDVSARKRTERELRIAATAFESQQAMFITDRDHAILRVNQAFTKVTGYGADEVIGRSPAILDAGRHDAEVYREIDEGVACDRYWQGEIWARRRNEESFPALASVSAVVDESGAVTNYVAAFVDISQRKQAEELIHNLSFYDALTGLPNRRLLLDRLRQTLLASRRKGAYGAVLFVDLDGFRALNDTRGHDIGDQLLTGVAKRIRACVHCEDTVARLGGDDFVVVLDGLGADNDHAATLARQVAERIRAAIRQPIDLAGEEYVCTASIGISLFNDDGSTLDVLMKQADASMFQAKRTGRDMTRFFDAGMQAALEERVRMESWLRKALPDQFELHYQMQVDGSGHIFAAEALIRWQHPERGMIPPMAFIPLAEETGLIVPIGRWVLETACRQLKAWETTPATRHLLLAVNVSARQFQQPDFVEQVSEVLAATGADPANLKLELTESMLVDNVEAVIDKMTALKAKGIRFSLDDFGTGFSSLSYLKRLPLDQLKIDRSFVRDVLRDANDAAIVRTIIALGQSLGLAVIAEGVETEAQRNFLAVHGCGYYQGYFFAKPLPRAQFEERLDLQQRGRRIAGPSPAILRA